MNYVSVSSSNIAAVAYEPETSTLGIRFHHGGEYHYLGVPEEIFVGLQSASSVGSYFDQYVKKAGYSYSKVG
jgi:KTSC domain